MGMLAGHHLLDQSGVDQLLVTRIAVVPAHYPTLSPQGMLDSLSASSSTPHKISSEQVPNRRSAVCAWMLLARL